VPGGAYWNQILKRLAVSRGDAGAGKPTRPRSEGREREKRRGKWGDKLHCGRCLLQNQTELIKVGGKRKTNRLDRGSTTGKKAGPVGGGGKTK